MGYQLITNSKPHDLRMKCELPAKVAKEFDYTDDDDTSSRYVKYRGVWYDVFDTQRIEPDNGRQHPMGWAVRVHPGEPLARFDGVFAESYFSGVAFRFVNDGDSVVCATYIS